MNLASAKDLLQARLGLRFEGPGEAQLRRALERRMAAVGRNEIGAYLMHLTADDTEWDALVGLLTIKETYFYREPEHLRLVTEHLIPTLLRGRAPGTLVRILSAGCATGEEPYSIAIALRERWGDAAARQFRIEAADLDPQAIAAARLGRYRPFSFRAMDPALTARWFAPGPDGTRQVAPSIRAGVSFRHLNLLADAYPQDLQGQDLIFYRNLSIYFDAATREAVLRRLRTLLRPDGYLIVGMAETLANGFGVLALCERDGVWYFAKRDEGAAGPPDPLACAGASGAQGPPSPASAPLPAGPSGGRPVVARASVDPPSPAPDPAPPGPTPVGGEAIYRQALALAQAERFAAALEVLAPVCAAPAAPPPHLRLLAHLLLEQGDLAGAAAAARRVLALDAWSADARVLLGRIAHAQGDLAAATEHLRRAIYACPDHWPAHFELAECRCAQGRRDAARREYRIALRLLGEARGAADQAGPLPAALPVADLRHLCRARLARLVDPA